MKNENPVENTSDLPKDQAISYTAAVKSVRPVARRVRRTAGFEFRIHSEIVDCGRKHQRMRNESFSCAFSIIVTYQDT